MLSLTSWSYHLALVSHFFYSFEHKKSCEGDLTGILPDEINDNGIPYHVATTGDQFLFDQTTILANEINSFKRRIIEGIHITN